ncbi:MAG: alpha/beta hydrolase [Xanthobacteraceae bacterium]
MRAALHACSLAFLMMTPIVVHGAAEASPAGKAKTELVAFDTSPFPWDGTAPGQDKPFYDVEQDGRRGHTSPRGGIYWEDQTYSDRRALLYIPRGFDPRRPALIVVFFHGNEATLTRDVRNRQGVPRQLAESGLNAVLVAPQFAVNALDSSAGRFWEPAVFQQFLAEATERLTELHGDERARSAFFGAPVVLVAYSGGYYPVAFILHAGRVDDRVRGVILLDGLFGEVDKFADWLARRPPAFFVSAYGKAARDDNGALRRALTERGVRFRTTLPGTLARGSVSFIAANDEIEHLDFMTRAWVDDPLKVMLRRIAGFSRGAGVPTGSTPKKK